MKWLFIGQQEQRAKEHLRRSPDPSVSRLSGLLTAGDRPLQREGQLEMSQKGECERQRAVQRA